MTTRRHVARAVRTRSAAPSTASRRDGPGASAPWSCARAGTPRSVQADATRTLALARCTAAGRAPARGAARAASSAAMQPQAHSTRLDGGAAVLALLTTTCWLRWRALRRGRLRS